MKDVQKLLDGLIADGCTISVDDGGDMYSNLNSVAALDVIKSVEESFVLVFRHGKRIGIIHVIPTLDPVERIADYTINKTDDIIDRLATNLAEEYL